MGKHVIVLVWFVTISTAAADPANPRNPKTAYLLSVVGIAAPLVLIGVGAAIDSYGPPAHKYDIAAPFTAFGLSGLVVAPSLGHLYAEGRWYTTGTSLRLGGMAVGVLGSFLLAVPTSDAVKGGGVALLATGCGLFLAGIVHDVATAGSATRRFNNSLPVAPALILTSNHTTIGGVAISGSF